MQTGLEIRPDPVWDSKTLGVLDSIPAVGGPRGTRGATGTGEGRRKGGGGREGGKEGMNEGSRGVGTE